MLNYFDPKLNNEVICDASPYGLSSILTQYCKDENKKRMVAYAGRWVKALELELEGSQFKPH